MQDNNPYSPPLAPVVMPAAPEPKKPIALWLLQLMCTFLAGTVVYSYVICIWFPEFARRIGMPAFSSESLPWYLKWFVVLTGSVVVIVFVQLRWRWGRWVAVAWPVTLVVTVAFNSPRPSPKTFLFDVVTAYVPFLLLIYFCAFSKKARAYFSTNSDPARS